MTECQYYKRIETRASPLCRRQYFTYRRSALRMASQYFAPLLFRSKSEKAQLK